MTGHAGAIGLYAVDDPSPATVAGGLLVDEQAGTVTGSVDGVDHVTLFNVARTQEDAAILLISADPAAARSAVFDAPKSAGVPLGRVTVASEAAGDRPSPFRLGCGRPSARPGQARGWS